MTRTSLKLWWPGVSVTCSQISASARDASVAAQVPYSSPPKLTPDTKFNSPLSGGTTGAYFLELRKYKPIATAKELARPLLVLQGDRDYQVTVTDDFEPFMRGLAGKPDVTAIRYPKANHAFVDGDGPASPADYNKAGQVSAQVSVDIAAWIKAH